MWRPWRLPDDLLPPLEETIANIDATFFDTIREQDNLSWPAVQDAYVMAIVSSFYEPDEPASTHRRAFNTQACVAIQRGPVTVHDARVGAEEFLQDRADELYRWLADFLEHPLSGCPYRFRHDDSEDRSLFRRDTVQAVKTSGQWPQFLQQMAACSADKHVVERRSTVTLASAEPLSPPTAPAIAETGKGETDVLSTSSAAPPVPVTNPSLTNTEDIQTSNRKPAVETFLRRCEQEPNVDRKLHKTDYWRVSRYESDRSFEHWQAGNDVKAGADAVRAFNTTLKMDPAEFVAVLRKRKLL